MSEHLIRRHEGRTALLRLARWYAFVLVLFGVVWWLSTALPTTPDNNAGLPPTGPHGLLPPSAMLLRVGEVGPGWIEALTRMLAALLLVIPIAGTYVRTRERPKYDRTLVQTVIVLPVAVTAVLMMVRDSLALAFGLAGVVAAVRFRNTLGEAGDAVYIFAAIVIGFAAGINALGIAVILSMLFVALELSMWYWDAASPTAGSWRHVALSHTETTLPAEEPSGDEPAREQVLSVEVADLKAAEPLAEEVLATNAKHYRLVDRSRTDDGAGTLEYTVKLRKHVGPDEVTRRLHESAGQAIRTVQWRAAGDSEPSAPTKGKPPKELVP